MLFNSLSCLLYSWLLPRQCLFCGTKLRQTLAICVPCFQDLPILPHHCPRCARFLPGYTEGLPCGSCLKAPPPYQKVYALFPYQPPIIHLIFKLKFAQRLNYAHTFGCLLAERIRLDWYRTKKLPDLILPVPLHTSRLRERGFNQAVEIARPLARLLQLPVDLYGITRIKATVSQRSLDASDRQKNMRGAFKAVRDYRGMNIAIIDDVVTTGSTIDSLCQVLKEAGVQGIDIWTIARRG